MHEFIGASPLSFVGGGIQQQQQQQYQQVTAPTIDQPQPEETNAERHYRDAANFCEVVAPAAIGSARLATMPIVTPAPTIAAGKRCCD